MKNVQILFHCASAISMENGQGIISSLSSEMRSFFIKDLLPREDHQEERDFSKGSL